MSQPNRFHVAKCFLAIRAYDGSASRVVELNRDEAWNPQGQFVARLNDNGFVEVRKTKEDSGSFLGVDGGDLSFPQDSSSPNLLRVFILKDNAQSWIDDFLKC